MKQILSFAFFSLLIASCTGDLGFTGESNDGAVIGKYKTMTIVGDFMYAVNNTQLLTFDLTDKANPKEIDKQDIGVAIENLYQAENVLFIGSQTNMHIYALGENGIPQAKSDTPYMALGEDVNVCDPVIANSDIAYVTLSTDVWQNINGCGQEVSFNELRTYNVSDLENPYLVNTYSCNSPQGMSIDGNFLFMSDGSFGFKIFELDHSGNAKLIGQYDGASYDLIAKDRKLLVISKEEIRQYDYTDINDLTLYSTLDLR